MNTTIKKRIEEINSGRVPEGYEKTFFGIFPCDWEKSKTLKDLGIFGKGRGIPGNKLISEGVPCVGYGDIYMKYNYHFEKAQSFVDESTAAESQKIRKGTLLFTATGETAEEIGKCVCYNGEEDIYAGGDIITFVPDRINSMFIAYQQYQNYALRQKASFGQGHSVVHIQKDRLEKLHIAYPQSSQEQSRIAEILMQWDKAIELQEKYIKQLELRKKALMQRLLTPKEGWKKTSLKEVLIERVELASKKNEFVHVTLGKEGVVDKTAQYNRDFLVKNDDKLYKITRFNDMCYNPANLKFGVICVNKYGTAIFSPIYITFSVNEGFNVDFIGEILSSANFIEMIRKYEEGTVYERQAVKPSDFLKGIIFVPEKKVQDRIALLIAMINKDLDLQTQKLDNLIKQRKALQQYLLTGIVRV